MTGKWLCSVKTMDAVLKLSFYVRVVGGPKEIKIQIAGRTIHTSRSGSPELAYDELGDYYFKDGETVQLICNNINDQNSGDIYLRYYDPLDTILIETDRIPHGELAFFQRTMKPEDNNHAIDCSYVTSDSNLKFPYRVVFRLINDSTFDDFTISINDLKMRPTETMPIANQQVKYYQFKYFLNHILTLSFKATYEEYDSIEFVGEDGNKPKCNSFKKMKKTPLEYTVQFHTKCINEENDNLRVYNGPILIAEILLKKSEFPDLLISGLTAKDVIDQYRMNKRTWVIDYWYTVGEALPLSCIAGKKMNLRWCLGTSVVANAKTKNLSYNFMISEEHNETEILCEDFRSGNTKNNRRTIIKLHRKSTYSAPTDDPDKDSNHSILIACAMVASILAIAMLVFSFYYCKHRTAKSSQTATDTLTNENYYSSVNYSTPIARNSEQIYPQGYMVQNSLYEAKSIDNDAAEYHYIHFQDIEKEKYANTRIVSPQADKLCVDRFTESNRTTSEVGSFQLPRYLNTAEGEENPQSSNNTETYDYSYAYNVKNNNSR